MGNTRKILRWGREISAFYGIAKLYKAHSEGKVTENYNKINNKVYIYSKILSDFSLALFFILDHILWFSKIGVLKNDALKNKSDLLSNIFWLLECVFTVISNNVEIYLLNKKI
mmetsp:Transcript_13932/g.21960  ORF Transcript_13932/g.21960 Transcript_13932/m.21960 type:complete len:113 (+) Transcript_13932:179-517(+)